MTGGVFARLFSLLASGSSVWGLLLLTALALLLIVSVNVVQVSRRRRGLRCFALPPMRNWLLGHLGIVSPQDGLFRSRQVDGIVDSHLLRL